MIRKILACGVLGLAAALLLPAPVQAHPLGNFTTNQHAGLRISPDGIDIDYILDLAEIPAFQTTADEIDGDHDGAVDAAESDAYAARTCQAAATTSGITVAGRAVATTARATDLTFPPGNGGLTTLRLQCGLHTDADIKQPVTITYRPGLYPDRIGWREITAVGDRVTITGSDVPAETHTGRLTNYPAGAATSDVRSATITVQPGGPAAPAPFAAAETTTPAPGADRLTAWFTDLVGRPDLTLGVGVIAGLIAVVLGGAHAVAPGHGKTIMAAYLVTSRGRIGHALAVAGTVAATHTVGVLVLGVLLATSLHLAPAALYEWLRLLSGILIALVGLHLLRIAVRAWRTRAAVSHLHPPAVRDHHHDSLEMSHAVAVGESVTGHHHTNPPDNHQHARAANHAHGHAHPHGHAHAHGDVHAQDPSHVHSHGGRPHTHYLPAADEPLRVKTLLAMGFAGGLSPSPSAVVVLLGAAALGRAWYGVLLVLVYGVGLAVTLVSIGLALARWGERLRRTGSGKWSLLLTLRMPVATATVILAVGVGMVAFSAAGLLAV